MAHSRPDDVGWVALRPGHDRSPGEARDTRSHRRRPTRSLLVRRRPSPGGLRASRPRPVAVHRRARRSAPAFRPRARARPSITPRAAFPRNRSSRPASGVERLPNVPCVVGAQVGVAHDQPDVAERDADGLGHDDRQAGPVVLAGVDLAGEGRDDPIATDVEPRPRGRRPAAGPVRLEDDDQAVRQDLEPVALGRRGHVPRRPRAAVEVDRRRAQARRPARPRAPRRARSRRVWTAARIRGYVPQRQTLSSSPARIASSPGAGVDSSRATVDRIIPGVQ